MTPEQFCYWLRGILEIQMAGLDKNEKRTPKLTEAQIDMIHQHLERVFAPIVSLQQLPRPTTGGAFSQLPPIIEC